MLAYSEKPPDFLDWPDDRRVVRNVGRALGRSVEALRRGALQIQRPTLTKPRPK